ncbi:hypothetical protein ACJMK2_041541 [Sinanodonta woodiana]|uniref:Uncharacterized protein n=1 Tax=Sinanodonta woodiana TaxID=1069815 RepID=A0ABD3W7F7_SINWO
MILPIFSSILLRKMHALWTFVLFAAFLTELTLSEITYIAQCNYDATTGFKTTVIVEKGVTDTVNQIAALTSINAIAAGCTVPQDGTTNRYTAIFTVDPTGATVTPAACGTGNAFQISHASGGSNADDVTFTFLVQTIDGYVENTDVIFRWKCTTADHNNVVVQTFTIATLPVDDLHLKSQLTLDVYKDSDGSLVTPSSTLELGGSYYLKLKHTYANSKNRPIGIYVNRLIFYEGADSTTIPHVVAIDNGCKQTVPAYGLSANFLKDAANSVIPVGGGATGSTDGVYVTASGTFQPALWLKSTGISTTLKIQAEIVQCLLADQSKCDDPQTSLCGTGKRRRRAAEDTGLQNQTTLGTRFTISLFAGSNDQISATKDNKGTMETCYQTYTFWIVALVFGILMLLCLIFAVYLYFRLRRVKESRRKIEEKYGVINPAF